MKSAGAIVYWRSAGLICYVMVFLFFIGVSRLSGKEGFHIDTS